MNLKEIKAKGGDWIHLAQYKDNGELLASWEFNILRTNEEYIAPTLTLQFAHSLYLRVLYHSQCKRELFRSELSSGMYIILAAVRTWTLTGIISLNNIKHLIFLIVKCDVLFEVRTGFLNII
jgi:hypothetical protein